MQAGTATGPVAPDQVLEGTKVSGGPAWSAAEQQPPSEVTEMIDNMIFKSRGGPGR